MQVWIQSFIFVFFYLSLASAQEPDLAKFVRLAGEGKIEKAYKELQLVPDTQFSEDKRSLKYFVLGQWASDLKKWSDSRRHFEQALKLSTANASHLHYLIGHTYKEEGLFQKAADSFRLALNFKPAQNIIYQSRFELSEMAIREGQLKKAREHLKYLERRWRGTPNYPEVVWRLMSVEFKDNRRHLACRWARKIYSRHPSDPLLASWGVDLHENKFEGKSIGCLASSSDVQKRIRHLQLSGLADQARREIELLRKSGNARTQDSADMLLVSHLENQGYPDEALKILIQHYDDNRRGVNYQNLLGKVAARAGEFQMAVGAYYNAYKLSPRSKAGKNALFTSAFLSYQIQDYDGASRKFDDVVKKFSGSGLARDAKWHLAWLQYLKGDYAGAEKSLRTLYGEKYYVRRRRVVRPFQNDRTQYWLAMSLVRQEKYREARELLSALAADKSMSFYSIVAKNRLSQIPTPLVDRSVASDANSQSNSNPTDLVEVVKPSLLFSPNGERESVADESESEENLQSETATAESEDTEDTSEESGEETAADGPKLEAANDEVEVNVEESEDKVSVTAFRDPRLRERFQRAHNLMAIGLNDWAKWELFEIERRTSNKTYLKMLMEAYSRIGSYNRSSYISEIYFGGERSRLGFQAGQDLWRYCYPRAFSDAVEKFAEKFGVPEALVFAIMRAESHFNKDAFSPVGARGLMQVMPYTANQLSRLLGEQDVPEGDLLLADVNIRLGTRYLSRLEKKFQEQVPLVAAGYNAGPHRVYSWLNTFGTLDMDEFIEHVPFVETRNYMKKVVRNFAIYNELYSNQPVTYVWLTQPVPVRVSHRPSPRENWDVID